MIGILGGTFNPVHHGHLRLAIELFERLNLQAVRLIPAARPPHRQEPQVAPELRFAMLQAAVKNLAFLQVDDRELRRPGFSYTVDTLAELRNEVGATPLCLLLGGDAFADLPAWHQWEKLINLAHLIVVRRPGILQPVASTLQGLLNSRQTRNLEELRQTTYGKIFMAEIPALAISSTEIRYLISQGRNPRYLLPEAVLEIIEHYCLYR